MYGYHPLHWNRADSAILHYSDIARFISLHIIMIIMIMIMIMIMIIEIWNINIDVYNSLLA